MEGGAVGYNFERKPPKDHPSQKRCHKSKDFGTDCQISDFLNIMI